MTPQQLETQPAELEAARAAFEQWRAAPDRRRRIPERLWAVAVEAARRYGVNRTARALKVDYYRLKQRTAGSNGSDTHRAPPATFVQLAPGALAAPSDRCVVELEDRSGCRMRIELRSADPADLLALARSFRET